MAQLHHVIGAILRDIAQGRVSSDLYSREVSRYYEQDSMLRLFPIPRTEIKEIQIDLRFGIQAVAIDTDRTEDRDARLAGLFERYVGRICQAIFARLENADEPVRARFSELDTPAWRAGVQAVLIGYFEENGKDVVSETTRTEGEETESTLNLKRDQVKKDLVPLLAAAVYEPLSTEDPELKTAIGTVKGSITRDIGEQLEGLDEEVGLLAASEYRVEVDVTADRLQELPEAAISTIRITTAMRNYVWSQVEDKAGQTVRRLIPE
jgi:hypothetical protein